MSIGTQFDRDGMARRYAAQHFRADPGTRAIYHLTHEAPEREIRLLEVNDMMAEMADHALEPLDFGVDTGGPTAHKLFVLDVTPTQWDRIQRRELALPAGWSLDEATPIHEPTSDE